MNLTSIFFLGFVFLVGNVILYLISKDLNILSITLALTITILFFTIENQDIKLLDEYENMRKESIKSSEAKSVNNLIAVKSSFSVLIFTPHSYFLQEQLA